VKYQLIDTEKELNSFAKETAETVNSISMTVDRLSTQIKQIVGDQRNLGELVKSGYAPTGNPTNVENIGAFVKAAVRGHTDTVVELGGRPGSLVTKDDLGTPLVNDSTTGSYLVPVQYATDILRVVEGASDLMPLVREWKMTSRTLQYPKKSVAPTFTQVASDGGANAESNPTFAVGTLTSYTYALWIPLSEALLEDQNVNLGEYFRQTIGEAAAVTFDTELLTSASTPTGLLADTGTHAVAMGTGSIGFADLSFADFVAMEAELATVKGALRGARWIMSPSTWNVVRGLVNDNGDPLIAPWNQGAARQVLDYPVVLSYEMPDIDDSAAETAFLALGNPGYLNFGNRIALEIKAFDATSYAVEYCEVLIRARVRWAFDVGLPGAFAVLSTAAV